MTDLNIDFKIKLCTNNKNVLNQSDLFTKISANNTAVFQSFSEWGLTIDPKNTNFGFVEKKDFAFVPLMLYSTTIKELNTLLSLEINNPDHIVSSLTQKYQDLKITLLEENNEFYYILVNEEICLEAKSNTNAVYNLVVDVIDSFAKNLQSNYCKYFVSNCFIIDGGAAFSDDKNLSDQTRALLIKHITEHVQETQNEKNTVDLYTESFNFRPFFGEGLNKLPRCDRSGELSGNVANWDWDSLYINPGMESEVFVRQEVTKVVEKKKADDQSEERFNSEKVKDDNLVIGEKVDVKEVSKQIDNEGKASIAVGTDEDGEIDFEYSNVGTGM